MWVRTNCIPLSPDAIVYCLALRKRYLIWEIVLLGLDRLMLLGSWISRDWYFTMGFDNECIPDIQSLAGEYFCPVCRLLVYPNEALQSQCTHLYCKPCLTYVVSTTRACPYDGYLVTEADSKVFLCLSWWWV
jgi:hypothetical protein